MVHTQTTFRLVGDIFDPKEVTARMGVEPTDSHSKGGKMGPRATAAGLTWKNSFWCIELPMREACNLSSDIISVLDMLPVNAAQIANDVHAEADIVVSVISGTDDQPVLSLTHEATHRLASAGISLTLYL